MATTRPELLGIATPVPMGNWQAGVNYQKLNVVRYGNASYIAKKQTNGSAPTVTQGWQEVWQLIVQDGKVGPQGPQGTTGASGINSALLSNVDGDSDTNGFTQKAVKGVAQAKNYYNLGAFDTYVSNGNGTGIVTRKTGVVVLKPDMFSTQGYQPNQHWTDIIAQIVKKPTSNSVVANIITNNPQLQIKAYYGGSSDGSTSVNMAGRLMIYYNEANNPNINFASFIDGTILEYELDTKYQYTENVIENQPIHRLNQDGGNWLESEFRKGLNLFNASLEQGSFNPETGSIAGLSTRVRSSAVKLSAGTYTISAKASADSTFGLNIVVYVYDSNGNYKKEESFTSWSSSDTITFTLSQERNVRFAFRYPNDGIIDVDNVQNIMLNQGPIVYPYEPYSGAIVREKDLSGIQLFPADVNPAQTIGGDWLDLGTVTIGSTTLHAYQKVNGGQ